MLAYVLLFVGSSSVALWGVMHLIQTRPVIVGFEPLSDDQRHVLRMEWIVEGVSLLFVATLVTAATTVLGPEALGSKLVYWSAGIFLLVMSLVSLLTGGKASPLPHKLCAPIFTISAVLILAGGWIA